MTTIVKKVGMKKFTPGPADSIPTIIGKFGEVTRRIEELEKELEALYKIRRNEYGDLAELKPLLPLIQSPLEARFWGLEQKKKEKKEEKEKPAAEGLAGPAPPTQQLQQMQVETEEEKKKKKKEAKKRKQKEGAPRSLKARLEKKMKQDESKPTGTLHKSVVPPPLARIVVAPATK